MITRNHKEERKDSSPVACRGYLALFTAWFRLLISRPKKKTDFCYVSHCVCDTFAQWSWEAAYQLSKTWSSQCPDQSNTPTRIKLFRILKCSGWRGNDRPRQDQFKLAWVTSVFQHSLCCVTCLLATFIANQIHTFLSHITSPNLQILQISS